MSRFAPIALFLALLATGFQAKADPTTVAPQYAEFTVIGVAYTSSQAEADLKAQGIVAICETSGTGNSAVIVCKTLTANALAAAAVVTPAPRR